MSETMNISTSRFLTLAGVGSRWIIVVFVLFGGWIAWTLVGGARSDTPPIVFLFLLPIAGGTGILTAARHGELDLLLGAGIDRREIWLRAWFTSAALPALMAILLYAMTEGPAVVATLPRLLAVIAFTGSVGFAAGMTEPRYAAGAGWLLLRVIFLITPAGLGTLMQLSRGETLPGMKRIALAALLAPESLLEPRMPIGYVIGAAAIGIGALAWSYRRFTTVDFGGKRT
jgi:hypothetical protein